MRKAPVLAGSCVMNPPRVRHSRKRTGKVLNRKGGSYLRRRRRSAASPSSEVPRSARVPGSGTAVCAVQPCQPRAHIKVISALLTVANSPLSMKALEESPVALIQSPLSDTLENVLPRGLVASPSIEKQVARNVGFRLPVPQVYLKKSCGVRNGGAPPV